MNSFRELGIPFPLHEGTVTERENMGLTTCSICDKARQHCFELNIGCALMTVRSVFIDILERASGLCGVVENFNSRVGDFCLFHPHVQKKEFDISNFILEDSVGIDGDWQWDVDGVCVELISKT